MPIARALPNRHPTFNIGPGTSQLSSDSTIGLLPKRLEPKASSSRNHGALVELVHIVATMRLGGGVLDDTLRPQGIAQVVKHYAEKAGYDPADFSGAASGPGFSRALLPGVPRSSGSSVSAGIRAWTRWGATSGRSISSRTTRRRGCCSDQFEPSLPLSGVSITGDLTVLVVVEPLLTNPEHRRQGHDP